MGLLGTILGSVAGSVQENAAKAKRFTNMIAEGKYGGHYELERIVHEYKSGSVPYELRNMYRDADKIMRDTMIWKNGGETSRMNWIIGRIEKYLEND